MIFRKEQKKIDKVEFISEFINIDWAPVLLTNDPTTASEAFFEKTYSVIDSHLPMKKVTEKEKKLELKPWITAGIRNSIKRRDRLLNRFIKCKDPVKKTELHQKYKVLRNKVLSLTRSSKKLHYKSYFEENSKNLKKTWSGIKSIINIHIVNKSAPKSLLVDGEVTSDPNKIVNGFNDYFSTVADKLQKSIHTRGLDFSKYLVNPSENNFQFRPADPQEVLLIVNSLDNNKASGPSSTPTEALKLVKNSICFPLTHIINLSFTTGIYPTRLKEAKIIPIYKGKGDPLIVSNYRPISLLSNINKIFEKIVYKRLYSFLEKYNCIYELQFGFRAKHSTNHALISLTERIREALDSKGGKFACGVFIDLQKAFDTVDHSILLKKLEHYGIRGLANNWFQSYLTGRKQLTSVNGTKSGLKDMKHGVPQGSVLGPLLFLIYINDLHNAIRFSTVHHFADDTNLLVTNSCIKKVQDQVNLDLKYLSNWLKANKIALNASKTEVIIFRHKNKPLMYRKTPTDPLVPWKLKIKLEGKLIQPSTHVKYVGVLLDSHLEWKYHVDELSTKLSRAVGMLAKIRHFVDAKTLNMIYYGIFSSLMLYGSQIWGQCNTSISAMEKLQNRALRILNFEHYQSSAEPLYKRSEILKFADSIMLSNFIFAHSCLQNNIPSALANSIILVRPEHVQISRNQTINQVNMPAARTLTSGLNSIKFKSSHAWNKINKLFQSKNLILQGTNFCKNLLKKHFLEGYSP